MWLDPGAPRQLAGLHIPPIGSQLVHSLSIVYPPLKLIWAGCGTRFLGMRSLTFAPCGNKTLFSIIFTTSPLAKSWIRACLLPNTGRISDRMICSTLAYFVFFISFLYLYTIAVVPSLSALFVPMCTSVVPPFPLPMIFSTLSVTCSILVPGKHTSYYVLSLVQSCICLSNYGVSHINHRVPLESLYHCRWIRISSFSILSYLPSNLGSICLLSIPFFPGCVAAFFFLAGHISDDLQIGRWQI